MRIRHLLFGGLILAAISCGGIPDEEVVGSLQHSLQEKKAPSGMPADQWDAAQALYKARDGKPLWIDDQKPNGKARALVDAVASADKEGLRAADYDLAGLSNALRQTYDSGKVTAAKLAALELRLTGLYLEYGSDMLVGRVDPQLINDGFLAKTRRKTADSVLLAAASQDKFADMIGELRPRSSQYQALLDGLAHYRTLADSGGWKEIPGGAIKPGERSSRIMLLRARLAATGDLGSAKGDSVYDDELNTAVNHFRARHNLPPARAWTRPPSPHSTCQSSGGWSRSSSTSTGFAGCPMTSAIATCW
jgi:murein L,D-transpeptidase YcbB/YkuD